MVETTRRVFYVHKISNRENITFALLKVVPHVKDFLDTYYEQKASEEYSLFAVVPTCVSFRDVIKERYYPIGRHDDQYTKWTTLWHERDQTMPEFTNVFHNLHTKMGIKDFE
jgi:hypothetical protein